MSDKYDESCIITLDQVEHVRQNKGMYIGEAENPNHLLYEALDNALDEANAGYANLVLVSIDNKKGICTVADNGRGIPFKGNTIERISTQLFTGGKFSKSEDSKSYKIASGLHGVGLVAVTALSDWMEVTVYRDNKKVTVRFEDCKVVSHKEEDFETSKSPCSTCIKFKPCSKYFTTTKFNCSPIKLRLQLASVHIEKLRLIYMEDGNKEVIKMTMDEYFKHNYFGKTDSKNWTPQFRYFKQVKDEKLEIIFGWDMGLYSQPVLGGSINLLNVNLGTHINRSLTMFQNVFENIAKKEKLNYNSTDFRIGFRMDVSMSLYKPEYGSQTKEKLTSTKDSIEHLFSKGEKEIEDIISKDQEIYNKIVYFIDSYRKSLTAKKTIIKTNGQVTRYNCSVDSKLKDCSSTQVEKCEIYITEGDSASGGLVQCRDPLIHAILGLRGKVLNLAQSKTEYLKNKEFIEMINAFGTGCGKDFDIKGLRYGKIIIATDADPDGAHIAVLLITAFLRMFPGLIESGKVYRAIMPLYGVRKFEGKFLPFYTDEEMLTFKSQHPDVEISRYKGLGEMMPEQLKECLLNPNVRRLQQIKLDGDPDPIFKLMSDAESKRTLILEAA